MARDRLALPLAVLLGLAAGCDGDGDAPPPEVPAGALEESREFRAIAGVSMGGYGAMNLGTKRPDLFGVIGSLGGPVDMRELIRHIVKDNLDVKPQEEIPREVGADFTFDHLPPYPDRDTRILMFQDLTIAFGNPFLHHAAAENRYLASDSEPATILRDDVFGEFTIPAADRGFLDGHDLNEDGLRQTNELPADLPVDILLLAKNTLQSIAGMAPGVLVGRRMVADLDGDGVFDVGDGIVVNLSEPFTDPNEDLVFQPGSGETFSDFGLDGVEGTGDFGEGNGSFDYDPDRNQWLAEDPLTRLASRSAAEIERQRIYMDVGKDDSLEFEAHYLNLVDVLEGKALEVVVEDGFPGSCASVPEPDARYLLVRYDGGHVGIPAVDEATESLAEGDFCGPLLIWRRLVTLIGFANESFPGGSFGPGGLRFQGDTFTEEIASPSLATEGSPPPERTVLAYRPPAFFNTDEEFPVLYFLGGYGQSPQDFARVGDLLDLLIGAGEVQNMFLVFLPGEGGRRGSFYVNHRIPHEQVPGLPPSSGRYEDSIIEDLIPEVENRLFRGRVRR